MPQISGTEVLCLATGIAGF